METPGLMLAVTHLNASVGAAVTVEHLMHALRTGSVDGLDARTAAVVRYLFVELEPALIARCVREAGSDLSRANELYKETLTGNLPRNPRWEQAIAYLIRASRLRART
jgi:hypothetical protein